VITSNGRIAYVLNVPAETGAGLITPIFTAANRAGRTIREGNTPTAMMADPRNGTLYVVNYVSQTVTPIRESTGTVGRPLRAGHGPLTLVLSPDGKIAYVADFGFAQAGGSAGHTVTPIMIATGTIGRSINVGSQPIAIAIIPARQR